MTGTPLPFVGQARVRLVSHLLAQVEETAAANRPRLVTLEAGTGWGKTRLLQELYTKLSAQQPEPRYWPLTLLDAVGEEVLTLESRRKRLYPATFTPPPGAVPHWFWWGITASAHRSGAAVQALAQDLVQVEAHTPALERRWRELAGTRERVGRLLRGEDAAELGTLLRDEGIGRAAEAVLGSAVPGLGFLMWAGGVVWRQQQRWSADRQAPTEIDARPGERTDLVTELATSLGSFARVGLPVIIVVEDLHDGDASLVEFLTQVLSAPRGPVIVIATAWPGLLDRSETLASEVLQKVHSARVHRLRQPTELPDLEQDALLHLVAHALPATTPADRRLLASRFTTPLTVEIACSVRSIRDAVADGDLRAEDVDELPRDVEGLYRIVWNQLPPATRDALMLSALTTPRTTGSLFQDGSWDPDVVASAIAALPWLDDAVREVLAQAGQDASVYAWVRRVDEWLRRFHEPAQLDVAAEAAHEGLGRRRRQTLHEALAAHLDPREPALSPSRRRWQAQMLVSLASEGFTDWTSPVWHSFDLLVEEAREQPDVDSLRTLAALLSSAPERADRTAQLNSRRLLGETWSSLGRVHDAIDVLVALVDERGEHDEAYAYDLNALAVALSAGDHADRSLELFGRVREIVAAQHGDASPELWVTRNNIAMTLSDLGRNDEAIEALESLVSDIGSVDPSRAAYDTARVNLALCYARGNDLEHAIFFSQTSAHMAATRHGPRHPLTLSALASLAEIAWLAGAADLAEDVCAGLVVTADDVLGEQHPRARWFREIAAKVQNQEPPVPPVALSPWTLEDETLLMQGTNVHGTQIYTFVRIHPDRVADLKATLGSGATLRPSDWGTVVASGEGIPTPRVIALTGVPEYMIQFTPEGGSPS